MARPGYLRAADIASRSLNRRVLGRRILHVEHLSRPLIRWLDGRYVRDAPGSVQGFHLADRAGTRAAYVVVHHGTDPDVARPDAEHVNWVGEAAPANAEPEDTWDQPEGDTGEGG